MGPSGVRLVVCQTFEREAAAVAAAEGWGDVELSSYPAHCNQPGAAVEAGPHAAVARYRPDGRPTIVVGGSCCMGVRGAPGDRLSVHHGDPCARLLAPKELVDALVQGGAYLVTPGWLARWRGQLAAWGLDRETARDLFHDSARRLVLLDTGVDPGVAAALAELAAYLELPSSVERVGLEHFRGVLARVVLERRLETERAESLAALADANRQAAEYAAAFDLAGRLSGIRAEDDAIAAVMDMWAMLFAPGRLLYLPLTAGVPGALRGRPPVPAEDTGAAARLAAFAGEGEVTSDGFIVRLVHDGDAVGVIETTGAGPEDAPRYLNLALALGRVAAMSIANARLFRAAEEAVRAREDFLSMASHELRTPLTTLGLQLEGMLRRLDREPEGTLPWAGDKLRACGRQVHRIERLLGSLLDVSRITQGRLHVELADVDLAAVVREVAARHAEDAARAGCTLAIDAAAAVVGRWDRLRLEQLATNLLSNSLKYGAGAPVEISAAGDETHGWMTVRDHGIGIDAADQARIFERFERVASHESFAGFGLGLWICRHVAEALGGRILVDSRRGEGATFTVRLPRAPAAPPTCYPPA